MKNLALSISALLLLFVFSGCESGLQQKKLTLKNNKEKKLVTVLVNDGTLDTKSSDLLRPILSSHLEKGMKLSDLKMQDYPDEQLIVIEAHASHPNGKSLLVGMNIFYDGTNDVVAIDDGEIHTCDGGCSGSNDILTTCTSCSFVRDKRNRITGCKCNSTGICCHTVTSEPQDPI